MRLIILGAGGYGRTVADVAAQTEKYERDSLFSTTTAPRRTSSASARSLSASATVKPPSIPPLATMKAD